MARSSAARRRLRLQPAAPLCRNFCAGLVSGVALLSLLVVILRAAGLLVFDARLLFGRSILRYGVIWLAGFLLVGLLEEISAAAICSSP